MTVDASVRQHYIRHMLLGCRVNGAIQRWDQPYHAHCSWGRLVAFGENTFAASRGLPLPHPGERHAIVEFGR